MNKTIIRLFDEYMQYSSLKHKPTTMLYIKRKYQIYIKPFFYMYKLKDIDLDILVKWCEKIKSYNFSDSFNKNVVYIMKDFFNYVCIKYDCKNYMLYIDEIKSINNNKRILTTWNIKDFKKFINKVDEPIYHALFNTLFFSGIRKGEALALHFYDIQNNSLTINKTLTKELFNGKRLEMTPKSKKSNRIIPIDIFLQIEFKKLEKYYTKKYGYFDINFYLFGGKKPLATTTIDRKKLKYVKLAKVKNIRIHDFRHSHATMLYNNNVDIKMIQQRLGHSDISTTMNIYVHTNEKQQKKLINKINLIRL